MTAAAHARRLSLPAACLALLSTGCSVVPGTGGDDGGGPETVVIVLVDTSQSTCGAETRASYRAGLDHVVEYFEGGKGGLLAVDVIDENPRQHSRFPVRVDFPTKSFNTNPLTHKDEVKRLANQAKTGTYRIIDGPRQQRGTAILDSLTNAERFFSTYPSAETRYLVLFSDMVEESKRLTFTKLNLADAALERLIGSDRGTGKLPNLKGVQVYVVGAGDSSNVEADPERIRLIQSFGSRYMAATGAELPHV